MVSETDCATGKSGFCNKIETKYSNQMILSLKYFSFSSSKRISLALLLLTPPNMPIQSTLPLSV